MHQTRFHALPAGGPGGDPIRALLTGVHLLLAQGKRPLVFTHLAGLAQWVHSETGLPFLGDHRDEERGALLDQLNDSADAPRGLVALLPFHATGYQALWATDLIFDRLPEEGGVSHPYVMQAIGRADRIFRNQDLDVWFVTDTPLFQIHEEPSAHSQEPFRLPITRDPGVRMVDAPWRPSDETQREGRLDARRKASLRPGDAPLHPGYDAFAEGRLYRAGSEPLPRATVEFPDLRPIGLAMLAAGVPDGIPNGYRIERQMDDALLLGATDFLLMLRKAPKYVRYEGKLYERGPAEPIPPEQASEICSILRYHLLG